MITHLPEGLRFFEDCPFARDPYQPLVGEEVRIGCRVEGDEEAPTLILQTGEKQQEILGDAQENGCYAFRAGSFGGEEAVAYRFQTPTEQTGWFHIDPLTKERMAKPAALYRKEGKLTLCFGEDFVLALEAENGLVLTTEQRKPEEKEDGEACEKATLLLDGLFSVEVSMAASFWKLKRLSDTIAAGHAFTVYRNRTGRIVQVEMEAELPCGYVLGTGERFDRVNQKNRGTNGCVLEKYTHQGGFTYLPIPFFMTETGIGWYRESDIPASMRFGDNLVISQDTLGPMLTRDRIFLGPPKEALAAFLAQTGKACLPPDWAFGLWVSANGWNCDDEVQAQLDALRLYDYPASVMVLEAWSDERTFYQWNGDGAWQNPADTVRKIKEAGLHLVLWQIPVIKHEWNGEAGEALERDTREAIEKGYVVQSGDGNPYRITDNWFRHSLLIDFTNPEACKWWFGKRKYLLEMGVEGFKTDGGEFLFEHDARLHDGTRGLAAHNRYPALYAQAYHDFMQENGVRGVAFSRAGYVGAQGHPLHWAGDQTSEWSELKAQLTAGISAGLSGVLFWGFDIGGFAGPLPSAELYLRATAMGCFSPVMQWHAEPRSGQFYNSYPDGFNNDRSPWNLAEKLGDEGVLQASCAFARLRQRILPYLTEEAKHCAEYNRPMMAHLCLDFPDDPQAWRVEDQYMLGRRYLVAPITGEGAEGRRVYLPKGQWKHFFTGEIVKGPCELEQPCPLDQIPVWERRGKGGDH